MSVGRTQRIVPERTRRLILRRDGGCRVPGCGHDRIVQIHHIIHWLDSGPTDTSNLIHSKPAPPPGAQKSRDGRVTVDGRSAICAAWRQLSGVREPVRSASCAGAQAECAGLLARVRPRVVLGIEEGETQRFGFIGPGVERGEHRVDVVADV